MIQSVDTYGNHKNVTCYNGHEEVITGIEVVNRFLHYILSIDLNWYKVLCSEGDLVLPLKTTTLK